MNLPLFLAEDFQNLGLLEFLVYSSVVMVPLSFVVFILCYFTKTRRVGRVGVIVAGSVGLLQAMGIVFDEINRTGKADWNLGPLWLVIVPWIWVAGAGCLAWRRIPERDR